MWTLVFRKQIDNLKTNHRVWMLYPTLAFKIEPVRSAEDLMLLQGVYVLTDNNFKSFSRMSMALSSEAVHQAQPVEPRAF